MKILVHVLCFSRSQALGKPLTSVLITELPTSSKHVPTNLDSHQKPTQLPPLSRLLHVCGCSWSTLVYLFVCCPLGDIR